MMEVENKTLLNGALYSGELENNIPHGKGIYETDKIKYEGYFNKGLFHGMGTLIDKERKYKYIGEFKDGNRDGFGKIIFDDGKYFEGLFEKNIVNKYGYMEYADGEVYVGEFKNNLADGSGTVYYTNGNMYTGLFSEDKEDGIGVMTEKDNKLFGTKVEYKKGSYTMIHGQVKLTTDINVHMVYRIIEQKDFTFFGMIDRYSALIQGIYHYANENIFDTFIGTIDGEFKVGVVYLKNGDKFEGFYENDKLTGKGKYTVFGKGTYIGEFIDGNKCGDFEFIDYNNRRFHHVYDNDKLLAAREEVQ